jgi:hypothetical protein
MTSKTLCKYLWLNVVLSLFIVSNFAGAARGSHSNPTRSRRSPPRVLSEEQIAAREAARARGDAEKALKTEKKKTIEEAERDFANGSLCSGETLQALTQAYRSAWSDVNVELSSNPDGQVRPSSRAQLTLDNGRYVRARSLKGFSLPINIALEGTQSSATKAGELSYDFQLGPSKDGSVKPLALTVGAAQVPCMLSDLSDDNNPRLQDGKIVILGNAQPGFSCYENARYEVDPATGRVSLTYSRFTHNPVDGVHYTSKDKKIENCANLTVPAEAKSSSWYANTQNAVITPNLPINREVVPNVTSPFTMVKL